MSKYYSDKQFWKQAEDDVEEMGEAIDLLKRANEEMLEAIDLLNDDEYGELDPMPVVDFGPELDALETNRKHFVEYVSEWRGIHTLVESVDEHFLKAVSKAYEAMSMLDIRNYKVKNTLGATEVIETYVDSKKGTYLQPEKERVYETRIKSEINIDDILYLSNIDGYRAQYDAYAAEQITGKGLNPKEVESMKRQYYTMAVGTSFEHEAYADEFLKGLSTTLDFIPVVGGAKQILEGLAGVTLTGDRLTSEQAWQHGLFGVLSLGIDIVTLGSGSMAVQAGKFVSQAASRVVVGWSMKTATEFMVSNGWHPGLVFMSNMLGGYLGNKAMNSVMNGTWFHNFSVTRDMKTLQRQNPELFDKVGKLLGTDARGTIEVAKGLGPKGYRQFLKDLPNVDDFLGQASVSAVKGTGSPITVDEWYAGMSEEGLVRYSKWSEQVSAGISMEDRIKINGWEYTPDIDLYLKYKGVYDNPDYFNQLTGDVFYPGMNGDIHTKGFYYGSSMIGTLDEGRIIDRFGGIYGNYTSPNGIPFEQRALPPFSEGAEYHRYKVSVPFEVEMGPIAPWFDQPGMGTQYLSNYTIEELLDLEWIVEVFD